MGRTAHCTSCFSSALLHEIPMIMNVRFFKSGQFLRFLSVADISSCYSSGIYMALQRSLPVLSKAPFFVSGKGFRHVHTLPEPTAGMISLFNSLDISYTEDGKLHWVYERTNPFAKSPFLYRSFIDAKTGDILPVTGKATDNLAANYSWRNNKSDANLKNR